MAQEQYEKRTRRSTQRSSKKEKKEKKERLLLKKGNYLVNERHDGELTSLVLTTVSGTWQMVIREDNLLFLTLHMLVNDEELHPFLEAWIAMSYAATTLLPDWDYFSDIARAVDALTRRMVEKQGAVSEEEDAEILDEERTFYEMKQSEEQS